MANKKNIFINKVLEFALKAFLLGLLFPFGSTIFLYFYYPQDQSNFFGYLTTNDLYLIIWTTPFILALGAYLSGKRIYKSFKLVVEQRNIQIAIINKNSEFISQIGKGDFSVDYKKDTNDKLGEALIEMREGIIATKKNEEDNKWISDSASEVSDMLRSQTKINELGEELIVYLCKKINAVQAAFYIIVFDNGRASKINLISSFAFSRKKYLNSEFNIGEGLVGQAVIESDKIYRTELPPNYITIKSGLIGDKKPNSILIQPLITNEKVYGVIELTSLHNISQLHQDFIAAISDIVARTIFNISINEETLNLLTESQTMAEELNFQKTQLMENAQEMVISQENLEKSNKELEGKIEEVNNAHNRQQALLEKASEIITIYEEDGTVRYESPSIKNILGYNPADIVGNVVGNDQSGGFHEDDKSIFLTNFDEVKSSPNSSLYFEFRYKKNDGEIVWLGSTLTNLMHDPSIKGLVMNSRDITAQRKAEEEQRMRAKMQALSENSLDLITRIDIDGNILYINPIIEKLTANKICNFINSKINNEELLPTEIKNAFVNVLETVLGNRETFTAEIKVNLENRLYYFRLNAMPEFDTHNELETILIVLHDISDQKQNEELILDKNKKITESINYSYRIQSALMPTEETLLSHFSNSFMIYKPKDIVSGDFPFIHRQGDFVYIAAIDCTGHGVPGALMSFIGHFALQQLMSENSDTKNAGLILDLLHERVQELLKQNAIGSESKDGMDAALVRINVKTMAIDYAGAHRPGYLIKDGIFSEIKADKYPIAGMNYKTRKPFINNTFQLQKGDSIIFNTDGLPDQFGGPDGKQKFMSKKVRELIDGEKSLDMPQLKSVIDTEFENWKSTYKQMDDVLMIGIKF